MANIKQVKDDALAVINGALTIIDKFPNLNSTNTLLSLDTSTNPFTFLMDAFKNTAGYDTLIRILSNFIVYELDAVEIAVKGILISNVKNLISCSINPYIPDDLLREGIVFDLRQLDITDLLQTCPTDPKIGQYFYFGCEEMTKPDDTRLSKDFNAVLWYMKNRATKREVWKNERVNEENGERPAKDKKDEKKDGIITLEYNERAMGIKDALGNGMSIQTPFNNSIHVFIGNTDYVDKDENRCQERLDDKTKEIAQAQEELENLQSELTKKQNEIADLSTSLLVQTITYDEYMQQYLALNTEIDNIQNNINVKNEEITNLNTKYYNILDEYHEFLGKPKDYKPIEKNYYYRKTLIEFNYDYITSLKLFDSKVVAAQLLDQLTGLLNIHLNLSYARQLIKNETLKMVRDIVESDDLVVSDCFFTFSNADYDAMLQKAEMNRSGLFSINGEENSAVKIDPSTILDCLNGISQSATQQEMQSIIEGSLTEISGTISDTSYEQTGKVNFGVRMNFIENLLNHLACVITLSVLSPKVYLLILINLKTLGRETNFNLQDFIAMFKQLIASIIRSVRDQLIQYLVNELMKLLSDLASTVATKMAVEQAAYYARLIKRLIDCFSRKRDNRTLDFNIDRVEHADIIQEEEQPKNTEC